MGELTLFVADSLVSRMWNIISCFIHQGDLMTVNVNLAGLPAVVVPCAHVEVEGGKRLPVGMQLIGRAFREAELLELAHVFEQTRQLQ